MATNTLKGDPEDHKELGVSLNLAKTRNWRLLAPVIVFVGIAIFLGIGLTMNPRKIPSALIGSSVPAFDLPPVQGRKLGLSSENLLGQLSLVNVFASWCAECKTEHPFLMTISKKQLIPIHGLNYKDNPNDAQKWLNSLGDPYTRTGADRNGRVAIDWGVYGVPETFLVNKAGEIVYKHIGALTPDTFDKKILPFLEKHKAK